MLVYVIIAIGEILLGGFIYIFYDPQRRPGKTTFYRKWMDPDAIFFDLEKDAHVIRKANKIVLQFCLFSALIMLINGLLHVYFNTPDIRNILVIITVITVLPLRFFYIIKKKGT